MERLRQFRIAFITGLTALSASVSYETGLLANWFPGIPEFILSVVAGVAGAGLANLLTGAALSSTAFRAILSGSSNAEGFYFLRTTDDLGSAEFVSSGKDKSSDALLFDGILHLEYDPQADYFRVHTRRLDGQGRAFSTHSEIAYVRHDGTNLKYLNYFKITYRPTDVFGISHGSLTKTSGSAREPDQLLATIFCQDSAPRRQEGTRIPNRVVRRFQRQFGSEWMDHFLKEKAVLSASAVASSSHPAP